MIKIFCPSRNRAAQLRLLLESARLNLWDAPDYQFYIVWQGTNEAFRQGYLKLQQEMIFDNIEWVEQTDFGDNWLRFIHYEASDIFALCVDDCVFFNPVQIDAATFFLERCETAPAVWCFSSRLGLNTTVQFYGNGMMQPSLTDYQDCGDYVAWNWRQYPLQYNYGYPGSLDGCFYRRADIASLMPAGWKPSNPRDLESKLICHDSLINIKRSLMVAPKQSALVSSANNCVQDTKIPYGLRHFYDEEVLNEMYLDDTVIDFDKLDFSDIRGAHVELEFFFKDLAKI